MYYSNVKLMLCIGQVYFLTAVQVDLCCGQCNTLRHLQDLRDNFVLLQLKHNFTEVAIADDSPLKSVVFPIALLVGV